MTDAPTPLKSAACNQGRHTVCPPDLSDGSGPWTCECTCHRARADAAASRAPSDDKRRANALQHFCDHLKAELIETHNVLRDIREALLTQNIDGVNVWECWMDDACELHKRADAILSQSEEALAAGARAVPQYEEHKFPAETMTPLERARVAVSEGAPNRALLEALIGEIKRLAGELSVCAVPSQDVTTGDLAEARAAMRDIGDALPSARAVPETHKDDK